ncbi:APC1-like protein [Mya arenaria]|uniref:APC1-like protein n=1 Tax=Mya arenaria TaxID=6604 RepID=A0ABY7F9I1_MYAAR|nr:APC1-like protein [Mya arenaria]
MITACDTQDFVPFGREYVHQHPGKFQIQKEQWTFNASRGGESSKGCDEELYVNGHTVVWSRGGQDGCRTVVKTFTMDTPVIQGRFNLACVWWSLAVLAASWKEAVTTSLHCLSRLPMCGELRMACWTVGVTKTSYLTDNTRHIVFTSEDPSLIFTYDTMTGVHSAWKVRKARQEECEAVSNTWDHNNSHMFTPGQNFNQSSSNLSRLYGSMSGVASPMVSPMRNYSGRINTPHLMSHSQSPLTISQPGIDRRSQSPANFGDTSLHRLHTPSPQVISQRSAGSFYRSPANMSILNEGTTTEWMEPITPEICLEHIWTENAPAIRDGSLGKSSKAFFTRDLCGQQYICYLISYRQQLRCVKFDDSNDLRTFVFGTVNIIPCKDAVPVESKDLLIILDTSGVLFVYSGITKINRLHVPVLPLGNISISMLRQNTPLHSPVRGGVFTSSRPPSAMETRFDEDFQLNQISPVPTELEEESSHFEEFPLGCGFIHSLRDNIQDRFTIELTNGHMFRCTIPDMNSSSGVSLCIRGLKHMLPRDLAIQMMGRWYTARNSPGAVGTQSEWDMFRKCLLGMMGYDTGKLAIISKGDIDSESLSPVSAKRARTSDHGTDEDWEYVLGSEHHNMVSSSLVSCLGLSECQPVPNASPPPQQTTINTAAILFTYIPACFTALHLEMKLNTLLLEDLGHLSVLLWQLASDLHCHLYTDYYLRDFPKLTLQPEHPSQVKEEHLQKLQYPSVFSSEVPSVFCWILKSMEGQAPPPVLYIPNVCVNLQNVVSLYALLLNKHMGTEQAIKKCLRKVPSSAEGHRAPTCDISMSQSFHRSSPTQNYLERLVLYMTQIGLTEKELMYLPVGISLPLREAVFRCRCNPPSDWPEEAYTLIGREDISKLLSLHTREQVAPPPGIFKRKPHPPVNPQVPGTKEEDDGMEHLDDEYLRLRYSEDLRVQEARRLMQSSRPVVIALTQKPEISDHDFIEEQERHLYSICTRTMALPTGRGMFTLRTYYPVPTETLPIPKLCLTGKAPPRNTTVDLSHIDVVANMTSWPLFHNGVAAGLRIADFSQLDSSWIMFNRPQTNDLTNEYAGFLMALGLNKHLVKMHILNKHDYLSKGHEMTTIGLLLGISAAMRSSMDLATYKILSIHLPAMLPPTSTELNVAHNVQVAAILGVGLLFQGTGHRHTADILLAEIGRPPGPEMENCTDRESYSLAAGLALGLVMFGKGQETMGTSDLSMADTLYHFMVGGHKRPLAGPAQERYRTPSYQIQEGNMVNVDVTSPGATLALGMLYFNTKNSAVSEWLKVPNTQFMLDQVRPDFLLLRTLARGLVMWDTVLPTMDFLKDAIPQILVDFAFQKNKTQEDENSIDYETMSHAYCNVVAGVSLVIGLKFAGSANQKAFETLQECMDRSLKVISTPHLIEQAGKTTVENCMMTILVSMAMVMAGTGSLEVMRMCRMFRGRVGPPYNQYVTYGSHMAISMAMGLLFLGGGKYTLSTKEESIAVMLCAFFPKFPTHSNDNRYHLQAFRHLYVLASELRTMLPRDVDTGYPCYIPVEIKFKDTEYYKNVSYKTSAPCTLPDLDLLEEIKILGPRYWPIVFNCYKNWDSLKSLLRHNGTLYVKQRAGHLSYVEDPNGYRSMLAKSLTADHSAQTCVKPDVIKAFTSDPKILALTNFFFKGQGQGISRRAECQSSSLGISQLKLIYAYYNLEHSTTLQGTNSLFHTTTEEEFQGKQLLKPDFILAVTSKLKKVFQNWLQGNEGCLLRYLKGESVQGMDTGHLAALLLWYDLPHPGHLSNINIDADIIHL